MARSLAQFEVLKRRGRFSVPGVVGDRRQQLAALTNAGANQVGINDLVADRGADHMTINRHHGHARARGES